MRWHCWGNTRQECSEDHCATHNPEPLGRSIHSAFCPATHNQSTQRATQGQEPHSQGQPSAKSLLTNSSTLAPWWPSTLEGASKFMTSIKAVKVDIKMVHYLDTSQQRLRLPLLDQAAAKTWGHTDLQSIQRGKGPPSGVPPAIRPSVIFWNPGGCSFGPAPLSSSSQGAGSGRGPRSPSTISPPVKYSLWDPLSEDVSSSGLQKVTCLLSLQGLRDWRHLSQTLPWEWLWLEGHRHLVLLAPPVQPLDALL